MKSFSKRICKIIVQIIFRISSFVYSYTLHCKVINLKKIMYTYWINKEFKSFQENSIISYPLHLIGGKYISIGKGVGIGSNGTLTAWNKYKGNSFKPEIFIGNYTSIGDEFHITAINRIIIGNNVLMGKKITITDNGHGKINAELLNIPPIKRPLHSKGSVIIGDGVWIGDKVTILPGVTIGNNSIIGANSVVTRNIPSNCVVGGVPAEVIKKM